MIDQIKSRFDGPMIMRQSHLAKLHETIKGVDHSAFLDRYGEAVESMSDEMYMPYSVNGAGQAIIDVSGMLVHKLGVDRNIWGLQGYDGLERQAIHADKNPEVNEVIFDFNTAGGMVSGVGECARVISEMEKPTVALVNELAASGGYWLACACDRIVAISGSELGSIGVISVHLNASGYFEALGFDHTVFKSGDMKDAGNKFRAMTEQEIAERQAEIDTIYNRFVSWVSDRREQPDQTIRNTEARIYYAEDALDMGLIDAVVTKDEILKTPANHGEGLGQVEGDFTMANQEGRDAAAIKEAVDAAVAAERDKHEADKKAAVDAAIQETVDKAAAQAEADKVRIDAVMALPETKGREALASHLAGTGMDAEGVKAALAHAGPSYSSTMDEHGGAGVDALVEGEEEKISKDAVVMGV